MTSDGEEDELRDLYIGQSHDLTWTRNMECPAEEEYLAMVDNSESGRSCKSQHI